MRIAITGKGGVGKTTLSGMLARVLAGDGKRVVAVDADPDANLASAIGVPPEKYRDIVPVARMKELARERTAAGGGDGSMFILNPRVEDLPERLSVLHEGVRLLVMGGVETGGGGCVCPEHTLVRRLMNHLLVEGDEVVIMDMEAGIEHLGRGTAESVDILLIAVEPGLRSLQTAEQIGRLAADIGLHRIFYVGSKVTGDTDVRFLNRNLDPERILGHISMNADIREADMEGGSVYDRGGTAVEEVRRLKEKLLSVVVGRNGSQVVS